MNSHNFNADGYAGDFCFADRCTAVNAGLSIETFGIVPLPLLPSTLHEIKQCAPGSAISNSSGFELDPSMISFANPMWDDTLKALVHRVVESLGLKRSEVVHCLEKVVLDDKGDCRRTSVLRADSIATLEVQFPSVFKGGSQVVRHDGMESVFAMGADDASCQHQSWIIARYADCEHEVREITQGCRLAAVYSLVWKGAGPSPCVPAMATVKQVVQSLRSSTGCAGRYLYGASPDALGRHGFSSLTERWDRQHIGLLQAASAHMAQGDKPEGLVLHICTASLIEQDDELGHAGLDLERRIYCPDGSEPSPAARAVLSAFCFPDDMFAVDSKDDDDCEHQLNDQGIDVACYWWTNSDPARDYDRGYASQVSPASNLKWAS